MNILFLILLLLILLIVGSILDSVTRVECNIKSIQLPILWLDEHSAQLEELGVEQSETDFKKF